MDRSPSHPKGRPASNAGEIQAADPRARRLAIALVAGIACAGAAWIASLPALERMLGAWLESDPARTLERARAVLVGAGVAAALPLLYGAQRAWRVGTRTLAAGRFPPPGLPVVRDTPVRRGAGAERMGRLLRGIALVLALLALALPLLLLRLAALLS